MSSEPKLVGRAVTREGDTLWLDRKHTIRKGDMLAAAPTPGRLRIGRLVVAAVEYSGRLTLVDPGAIVAMVADPDFGDWIFVVDEPSVESCIEGLARRIAAGGVVMPDALPVRQSFAIAGTFRVYFNRHQAAPLVWCVALGEDFELAIAELAIAGAAVRTVYRPRATPDDEDGKPSAWLEVTGVLAVAGGEARITRGVE